MSDDLEALFAEAAADPTVSDAPVVDNMTGAEVNFGDDDESVSDDTVVEDDDDSVEDEVSDTEVSDDGDDDDADDTEGATDESEFDWASVKDQRVEVKVDGETFEVTLDELRSGYMRQKAFTQKTQQIAELQRAAEWAVKVQQALNDDPQGTLTYLAGQLGVELSGGQDDYLDDLDPEVRPLVSQLKQQEQELARLKAAQAAADEAREQERYVLEAQRELFQAKQEFPDMDEQKVLTLAAEKGIGIREAHLILEGEAARAEKARAAEAAKKAEKLAAKKAAKRTAAGATLRGSSSQAKASDQEPVFDTFEDLFTHQISLARSK